MTTMRNDAGARAVTLVCLACGSSWWGHVDPDNTTRVHYWCPKCRRGRQDPHQAVSVIYFNVPQDYVSFKPSGRPILITNQQTLQHLLT